MHSYSIITICLNSEKTIQKSMDSVLKQKYLPKEYIFVDGGSTDSTIDIIKELQIKVDNNNLSVKVKLISQIENSGIYGAMNIGVKAVKSDIVFILNSDDWYEANTAEIVLSAFAKSADIDIVYSSLFFHEKNIKYLRKPRPLSFLPFMMPIAHPTTFVKKSVYDKIAYFNEDYSISSDYDFIYRCYSSNLKFLKIKKVLVNMLLGGAANTHRVTARLETYNIAKKYSKFALLPFIAYIARKILKK